MFTRIIHAEGNMLLPQLSYSDIRGIDLIPSFTEIVFQVQGFDLINEHEKERLISAIRDIFEYISLEITKRDNLKLFNSLNLGLKGKTIQIQGSRQNKKELLEHNLYSKAKEIYESYSLLNFYGIPHPHAIVRLALMNLIKERHALIEA